MTPGGRHAARDADAESVDLPGHVDRLAATPWAIALAVAVATSFLRLPGSPILRIIPTALAVVAGMLGTSPRRLSDVRVAPALVLLLIWFTFSLSWTIDVGVTLQQLFREVSRIIAVTLAVSLLGYDRTARVLGWLFRLGIVLSYVTWLIDPVGSSLPSPGDSQTGLRGPFNHKNTMAKVCMLAILYFIAERRRLRNRAVWVCAAAVLLVFSTATTALFATLFGALLYFLLVATQRLGSRARLASRLLTVVLGGVAVLGVVAFLLPQAVAATGKDTTLTGRTEIWRAAIPFVRQRPFTGYGFGALYESTVGPGPEITREVGFFVFDSHNSLIEQLLQAGIVGASLMALWTFGVVRRAMSALSTRTNEAAWLLANVASLIVLSLTDALFIGWLNWFAILTSTSYVLLRPNRT